MRVSVVVAGVMATLVGLGGTLAVILEAAHAVGADHAQTASWVTGLCVAMGVPSLYLSLRHRIPIIAAWSTPGAVLIAASAPGSVSLPQAVAAFLLAAVLILLTAAVRPLGALIERIPTPIAAAMLAGILFRFVVAIFQHAAVAPWFVLPLVGIFLVARLLHAGSAALVVLIAGTVLATVFGMTVAPEFSGSLTTLHVVVPEWDVATLIGLGLPLYLVTMASQNLPGFAVLRAAGYPVPVRSILTTTGLASLLTAPFGAHTSNLAAITAAICTGPDAHPDPARRWHAGVVYGIAQLVLALLGASLVSLFASLPGALIATVAGCALLSSLTGAFGAALVTEKHRLAAVLTFVITASGLALGGVGSAFWGLAGGLLVLGLDQLNTKLRH
jgi:benzoate membrane transport protein